VSQDVVALDTRTGATVWQRPGDVYTMTTDAVLLSKWDPETSRTARLTLVRLSDGAVLWSRAFTTVTHVATTGPDRDPESVVVATFDGRIEVMRWSDGTPSATATVPWVPDPVPDGWYADLTAVGDTLYVSRTESMRTVVTAYAIGDLRRRWEITAPFIGTPTGCGPVLCVSRGNGMAMYDPATGALRWEIEGWTWASEIGPGRLLAETSEQEHHAVLDATTGRMVADLGDAFALWDQDTAKMLVLRFTTQPAGFSSVTELDPGTGRSWLRGKVVAATEGRCMLRGGYLACHHLNGALTVTDVG
jgi:hypothetical protein